MPLYIQNDEEVEGDDDASMPTHTPSVGSSAESNNDPAIECGNRVLELMEKHRREIRARMAVREKSFRDMLEQPQPRESRSRHRKKQEPEAVSHPQYPRRHSSSSDTRHSPLPTSRRQLQQPRPPLESHRNSNTLNERFVQAYHQAVSHEQDSGGIRNQQESRYSLGSIYSEDYLEPPLPSTRAIQEYTTASNNTARVHIKNSDAQIHSSDGSSSPSPTRRSDRRPHPTTSYQTECIYDPDETIAGETCSCDECYERRSDSQENNNRVKFDTDVSYQNPPEEPNLKFNSRAYHRENYISRSDAAVNELINHGEAESEYELNDGRGRVVGRTTSDNHYNLNQPGEDEYSTFPAPGKGIPEERETQQEELNENISRRPSRIATRQEQLFEGREEDEVEEDEAGTPPSTNNSNVIVALLRSQTMQDVVQFCRSNGWKIAIVVFVVFLLIGFATMGQDYKRNYSKSELNEKPNPIALRRTVMM